MTTATHAERLELHPAGTRVLNAAVRALDQLSVRLGRRLVVDWRDELTRRARILGTWPDGRVSGSGTCRILRAADGWVALNLARPADIDALPAVLERPVGADHWEDVTQWASEHRAEHVVLRARLLGVAAAQHDTIAATTPVPLRVERRWTRRVRSDLDGACVVDLSALWAGPLAARLLADAGAEVVKVEDPRRPDGARETPAFYRSLHAPGQTSVALDLGSDAGRRDLRGLLEEADVVIEAARPRALEQLGCAPGDLRARPGRVWLSITGYGRRGDAGHWIAFGDDAAVAGGLTSTDGHGDPALCADAVADPVTGILAAGAVLGSLAEGGGELLDVALAGAAAAVARGIEARPTPAAGADGVPPGGPTIE